MLGTDWASYIEHVVVRSAVWVTVSHWLHGHPWAFPVVILVVLVVVVRGRLRKGSKRSNTSSGSGRGSSPKNVDELVRPTTGKGHWEWVQESSRRTSDV